MAKYGAVMLTASRGGWGAARATWATFGRQEGAGFGLGQLECGKIFVFCRRAPLWEEPGGSGCWLAGV
eukprot:11218335-Lingulodinium_polyedra.AAC.1